MNKGPKTGIVIPSYERIEYLKEAVDSAINQTYENLEIIIIDDCSPDKAIREYLEKINNPKVKWFINKTNLGTTKNYDTGVRLLSQDVEWCIILDNDDFLDKDFIKESIKTHFEYPQFKVIHGKQVFINADKKIIDQDGGLPILEIAEDYLSLRCLGRREIRSSSIFFNLGQFKKIGGYPLFPSGMCTDSVFIFSLAFDNMLTFSEKALIYTRIHDKAESITADNLFEKLISIKQMQSYCLQVYENNPGYSQRNKKQIMKCLEYYAKSLSSALLIRKYREMVNKKSKCSAKESLKEIIEFCHKNRLFIPISFLILINFFIHLGVNLEKSGLYNIFMSYMYKLDSIKIRLRHFLFIRHNFSRYIKNQLKKISLAMFINKQLNIILNAFLKKSFVMTGFKYCCSCGCYSLFYWDNDYENLLKKLMPKWDMGNDYIEQMIKRENEFCVNCRSVFRLRVHAKTILKLLKLSRLSDFISFLKENPSFMVYEAANYSLFRNEKIKKIPNYLISEFHPKYPFGQKVNGVRNENLEKLTFDNQSFDILITGEVLEHVSNLSKSLSEIHRVLKFGGYHIFTVPVNYSMNRTRMRVVAEENGKITHLLPPAIHGDDITSGILGYRDFGRDIDNIIKEYGFSCQEEKYYLDGKHIVSVYISRKV